MTKIDTEHGTVTVSRNSFDRPNELYLSMKQAYHVFEEGYTFTAIDAGELRHAIDKAVGGVQEDSLFRSQVGHYHQLAMHEAFDDLWPDEGTPSSLAMSDRIDELIAKAESKEDVEPDDWRLDWSKFDRVEITHNDERVVVGRETVGEFAGDWVFPTGFHYADDQLHAFDASPVRTVANPDAEPAKGADAKPYRPVDRDRLLRHIGDIEATLTRRNVRVDQLEKDLREAGEQIESLNDEAQRYSDHIDEAENLTAREYLDLAWENAIVPEDGMIHAGETPFSYLPDNWTLVGSPASETRPVRGDRVLDSRPEPVEPTPAEELANDIQARHLGIDRRNAERLALRLIHEDGWSKS